MATKFDITVQLPGSVWNNFTLWSTTLETSNESDECAGFCYFQDPNPLECGMAVAQNGICYMGAFEKTTGQSNTFVNPLISDTLPVRVNTGIIKK
jgi:hypothetical protein